MISGDKRRYGGSKGRGSGDIDGENSRVLMQDCILEHGGGSGAQHHLEISDDQSFNFTGSRSSNLQNCDSNGGGAGGHMQQFSNLSMPNSYRNHEGNGLPGKDGSNEIFLSHSRNKTAGFNNSKKSNQSKTKSRGGNSDRDTTSREIYCDDKSESKTSRRNPSSRSRSVSQNSRSVSQSNDR